MWCLESVSSTFTLYAFFMNCTPLRKEYMDGEMIDRYTGGRRNLTTRRQEWPRQQLNLTTVASVLHPSSPLSAPSPVTPSLLLK